MVQLYIVPAGTIPCVPLAGVKLRFPPLQSWVLNCGVMTGLGINSTLALKLGPAQPSVIGVTT